MSDVITQVRAGLELGIIAQCDDRQDDEGIIRRGGGFGGCPNHQRTGIGGATVFVAAPAIVGLVIVMLVFVM